MESQPTMTLNTFADVALSFKGQSIAELALSRQIAASVGDSPEDVVAAMQAGVYSICLAPASNRDAVQKRIRELTGEADEYSYILVSRWKDVLRALDTAETSNESLLRFIDDDYANYSRWMFDLDNKTQLMLLVASFIGAAIFATLGSSRDVPLPLAVRSLLYVALVSAALAIVFAIRGFQSRHTAGVAASRLLTYREAGGGFRNMWRIFWGRTIRPAGPTIPSVDEVKRSQHVSRAYLKELTTKYGTLDPATIGALRMIGMRSANYTKMYPELWTRTCIFLSLLMMMLAGLIFAFWPYTTGASSETAAPPAATSTTLPAGASGRGSCGIRR